MVHYPVLRRLLFFGLVVWEVYGKLIGVHCLVSSPENIWNGYIYTYIRGQIKTATPGMKQKKDDDNHNHKRNERMVRVEEFE